MNDRYSHVITILEVTVLIFSVYKPSLACQQITMCRSLCVQAPKEYQNYTVFLSQQNQVFHAFNSLQLLIAIYVAIVHVLNSLTPGLVPTSSLWLVTYVLSSYIDYVPQCR